LGVQKRGRGKKIAHLHRGGKRSQKKENGSNVFCWAPEERKRKEKNRRFLSGKKKVGTHEKRNGGIISAWGGRGGGGKGKKNILQGFFGRGERTGTKTIKKRDGEVYRRPWGGEKKRGVAFSTAMDRGRRKKRGAPKKKKKKKGRKGRAMPSKEGEKKSFHDNVKGEEGSGKMRKKEGICWRC